MGHGPGRVNDRGQSTVELAAVLPALLIVTLLVVQAALVARDRIALTHRCRAAARQAMVEPTASAATAAGAASATAGAGFSARLHGPRQAGALVTVTCRQWLITGLPLVGPMLGDPEATERFVIRVESVGG
ncbi:MAG: pilus assembly protein [Microthrixaceae bacterium]